MPARNSTRGEPRGEHGGREGATRIVEINGYRVGLVGVSGPTGPLGAAARVSTVWET